MAEHPSNKDQKNNKSSKTESSLEVVNIDKGLSDLGDFNSEWNIILNDPDSFLIAGCSAPATASSTGAATSSK